MRDVGENGKWAFPLWHVKQAPQLAICPLSQVWDLTEVTVF